MIQMMKVACRNLPLSVLAATMAAFACGACASTGKLETSLSRSLASYSIAETSRGDTVFVAVDVGDYFGNKTISQSKQFNRWGAHSNLNVAKYGEVVGTGVSCRTKSELGSDLRVRLFKEHETNELKSSSPAAMQTTFYDLGQNYRQWKYELYSDELLEQHGSGMYRFEWSDANEHLGTVAFELRDELPGVELTEAAKPGVLHTVSAGIRPFTAQIVTESTVHDEQVIKFARRYYPARLIQWLTRSAHIDDAYIVFDDSPSVDFVVSGTITQADGEKIALALSLADPLGRTVIQKHYSVDLRSESFKRYSEPEWEIWSGFVNDCDAYLAGLVTSETKWQLHRAARLERYLHSNVSPGAVYAKSVWDLLDEGASIENDKLHAAVTTVTVNAANSLRPEWVMWQRSVTESREQARAAKTTMIIGAIGAVASLVGQGVETIQYPETGVAPNFQMWNTQLELFGDIWIEGAERKAAALAAEGAYDSAIAESTEPVTVKLGEVTIELVGTYEEKLKKLRDTMTSLLQQEMQPGIS